MDDQKMLLGIRAYLLTKALEPLLTREGVINAMINAPPLIKLPPETIQ
jgi:hypothetical protein